MLAPGHTIGDRFVIERRIGAGGMGHVFRARDLHTGRPAAIKVLVGPTRPAVARFAREAQLLARLRHPAIVRYLADGLVAPDQPYLAMDWLDGCDLARLLARRRLAVDEVQALASRVASALALAHGQGVVHRDIKPSNLFVPGGDLARVVLLDFGIARADGGAAALTRTGARLGTPSYMAPEQVRGRAEVGPPADVFALGCVLWECLTGARAFSADDAVAVQARILLDELPPVGELCPDAPPALESLIQRMLSKDPADRPADGAALSAELAALRGEGTSSGRPGAALSGGEQRLVSVLVVMPAQGPIGEEDATVADGDPQAREGVTEALHARRAHVDRLSDGTLVATMRGRSGAATDEAARAALAALEVRAALGGVAIAVATGKALPGGRLPVGEAIDRAVEALRRGAGGETSGDEPPIHLDEVTAGLLEPRFHVGHGGRGWILLGQREPLASPRTLLGVPTPFVGRARVLGHLEATVAECVEERAARVVLVTGQAGAGKTRLAGELVRRLRERGGARVWTAQGEVLGESSPYGLFAQGVRRDLAIAADQPLARRQRTLRAGLARLLGGDDLARVGAFLGEMLGLPPAGEPPAALVSARADAQVMAHHLRRAALDYLRALAAGDGPLLILLDDLHWSDQPTVKLVDAALRELRDRPVMVLALARPEVHRRFPELWRERACEEIALGGLPRRAQERLARHVLAGAVDDALLARLAEQSSGNAFYLEELIRAAAGGRAGPPETVLAMVQTRLETLPSGTRRLLRAASVFGERFTQGGALALLGRGGGDDDGCGGDSDDGGDGDRLEALVDAELIEPEPGGGSGGDRAYRFRHALVREAAYASLTERDRVLGHALAGDWLERGGECDAFLLADHFARGRRPERAVTWYRQAAQQALEANDFEGVSRAVHLGESCGAGGDDLAALRLAELEALHWTGDYEPLFARAVALVAEQRRGSRHWFSAVRKMVTAAQQLADRRAAVELAGMLIGTPLEGDGIVDGSMAHLGLMNCLRDCGEVELARRVYAHVVPAADRLPDWARLTVQKDRFDSGVRRGLHYFAIADAFTAAGDVRRAWQNRINVGYWLIECGAYDQADEVLRECEAAARRLDSGILVAHALSNVGHCLGRRGRLEEASRVLRRSIELHERQGSIRLMVGASGHLVGALLAAGRARDALAVLEPVVERSRHSWLMRPQALALLAGCLVRLGRPGEALAAAREAHELLGRLGGVEAGEVMVRLSWAEALWASGAHPAARQAIEEARDHVLGEASHLPREDWRACFLSRVWENARILELADAYQERRDGGLTRRPRPEAAARP